MNDTPVPGTPPGRTVLEGAFALLRVLPEVTGEHQVRDLAAATGIPRGSVYRLLAHLGDVGAVELHGSDYVLSPSVLSLAQRVEPVGGLRRHATEVMGDLRAVTGATITLTVTAQRAPVYLAVIPGHDPLPVTQQPGHVLPAGTASARVLDPAGAPRASSTRPDRSAVDDGQLVAGLTCFATAVALPDGGVASLAVTSPAASPATRFAPALRRAAHVVGERLRRDDPRDRHHLLPAR